MCHNVPPMCWQLRGGISWCPRICWQSLHQLLHFDEALDWMTSTCSLLGVLCMTSWGWFPETFRLSTLMLKRHGCLSYSDMLVWMTISSISLSGKNWEDLFRLFTLHMKLTFPEMWMGPPQTYCPYTSGFSFSSPFVFLNCCLSVYHCFWAVTGLSSALCLWLIVLITDTITVTATPLWNSLNHPAALSGWPNVSLRENNILGV